jgi:hypothetical protein
MSQHPLSPRKRVLSLAFLVLGLGITDVAAKPGGVPAAPAAPHKTRFVNAHPIAPPKTGFCHIDVPHVHDYAPSKPALFQPVGDQVVFTGDPVPFGYEGEKVVYYGHHPVPLPAGAVVGPPPPTFCFMKGPHYHNYQPPEGPGFKQKDNVIFYIGVIPPEVAPQRPQLERAIEVEYRPFVAMRPQVVVVPPPEWQGTVWIPPPAVVAAPGAPTTVIAPAAAPVVVAPPQPTVVVAPPRPAVIVAPPSPIIVAPGHGWKGKGKGWKGGKHKGWGHW